MTSSRCDVFSIMIYKRICSRLAHDGFTGAQTAANSLNAVLGAAVSVCARRAGIFVGELFAFRHLICFQRFLCHRTRAGREKEKFAAFFSLRLLLRFSLLLCARFCSGEPLRLLLRKEFMKIKRYGFNRAVKSRGKTKTKAKLRASGSRAAERTRKASAKQRRHEMNENCLESD